MGFPIRKSADQRVLSPPHGLSQSATSFIASYRQGIHQTPFMRLIRSSKRKTRSGCAGLGILFVHLRGRTSAPRRPFGRFGASFHPQVYAQNSNGLRYWLSIEPAAILDKRQPASVSVFRLGKTAFACMPCRIAPPGKANVPEQHKHKRQRRPPLTRERRTKASRVSLSSRCQRP